MIQPRGACASIGRMAGLRTRTEVTGMIPDNPKRPDVVYTTDDGTEIITDVVTCCPVLMSASANNCAHSATTIGAASASGITSKHQAWGPSLRDLPYEFYALAHEPGRISDTALSLLDRLISRLPTNDRPRLRTYAHQLLADYSPWSRPRNPRALLMVMDRKARPPTTSGSVRVL